MSAKLTWQGLNELYEGLRKLPAELAAGAAPIVLSKAEEAGTALEQKYQEHRYSGDLAEHVVVQGTRSGQFGAAALVKNTSKHAHLFENGTQARHTNFGVNRGSMPAGNVFVPLVIKKRREMYDELKGLLEQAGLEVSGDA